MRRFAVTNGWRLFMLAFWIGFLSACGPRSGQYPYAELGTPEHHIYNGFAFLKKERLIDAQREFEQALLLDPKCSPALRGLGLVYGRRGDFAPAFDEMERARAYGNHQDQALAEVGMMSLYRMEGKDGWLIRVEASFARALSLEKQLPEASLEMGVAYKHAYRFREAEEAFKRVLKSSSNLSSQAEEEMLLLDKIERADPRSDIGKELVLLKAITRGQAAALLVRETHLIEGLSRKEYKAAKEIKALAVPSDLADHPMKDEIMDVAELDIQGLGVSYNGSSGADQSMTRAAFASALADVLVRKSEKPELYQKYSGMHSPFLDLRENSPYFGSIMICSDWAEIMRGWGGYFYPMETISGVDALLALRAAEKKLEGIK